MKAANPPDTKPHSKWYQQHCFDLHRQRIMAIKPSLDSHSSQKSLDLTSHLSQTGSVQRGSNYSGRNLEIQRENEILLMKIATISTGRSVTPTQKTKSSFEPNLPTSLNKPFRVRELQRIASENRLLAGRIVIGKPSLDVKDLEKQFQKSRKYKQLFKSAYVEPKSPTQKLVNKNGQYQIVPVGSATIEQGNASIRTGADSKPEEGES